MPLEICSICNNMFIQGYNCSCNKEIKYCYICFGQHVKTIHNQNIPDNNMVTSLVGEVVNGKSFARY